MSQIVTERFADVTGALGFCGISENLKSGLQYVPKRDICFGMQVPEMIDKFGGAKAFAASLGLSESAVRNWPERGIPKSRLLEILRLARVRGLNVSEDDLLSTTKRRNGG